MYQLDHIHHESNITFHHLQCYVATHNYPLVVAMHGGFGNAAQFERQSGLSEKADEENFIVVYPEGVLSPTGITTWNAGVCCGYASNTNVDDVNFIRELLNKLESSLRIFPENIYATGMSNGGYMAYRLACELSDRIAAIAPVACSMTMDLCKPNRQVPILHFHSYLDMNVNYDGGYGQGVSTHYSPPVDSVLTAWAQNNACKNHRDTLTDNNNFTHLKWSDCNCLRDIEVIISKDGGHSWPGGVATLLGDPPSRIIHATEKLWTFFEKHHIHCLTSDKAVSSVDDSIIIFPNPANSTITISGDSNKIEELIIYDNQGRIHLQKEGPASELDISQLPSGLYHLVIKAAHKVSSTKIVKL